MSPTTHSPIPRWCRLATAAGLALCSATLAWSADAPATPDWTLAPDGATLLQHSTRLAWARCAEGSRWTGKDCVGEPLLLDHAEALALARTRAKADGLPWRLPHLKELQQLARLSTHKPIGGKAWLPDTSQGWSWSATAAITLQTVNAYSYDNVMRGVNGQNVNQMKFLHGWVVNTGTGESRDDVLKRTPMMVRLVRPAE